MPAAKLTLEQLARLARSLQARHLSDVAREAVMPPPIAGPPTPTPHFTTMAVGSLDEAERLLELSVVAERLRGSSWSAIGHAAGRTREGAREEWGHLEAKWADTVLFPRRVDRASGAVYHVVPQELLDPHAAAYTLDAWVIGTPWPTSTAQERLVTGPAATGAAGKAPPKPVVDDKPGLLLADRLTLLTTARSRVEKGTLPEYIRSQTDRGVAGLEAWVANEIFDMTGGHLALRDRDEALQRLDAYGMTLPEYPPFTHEEMAGLVVGEASMRLSDLARATVPQPRGGTSKTCLVKEAFLVVQEAEQAVVAAAVVDRVRGVTWERITGALPPTAAQAEDLTTRATRAHAELEETLLVATLAPEAAAIDGQDLPTVVADPQALAERLSRWLESPVRGPRRERPVSCLLDDATLEDIIAEGQRLLGALQRRVKDGDIPDDIALATAEARLTELGDRVFQGMRQIRDGTPARSLTPPAVSHRVAEPASLSAPSETMGMV